MDSIYLEKGMTHPNKARPWSVEEARFVLEKIDPADLSSAGKRAHDYIEKDISGDKKEKKLLDLGEVLRFQIGARLNPEFFARINLDKDGETSEKEYRLQHGYEERKAFLELPLELTLGNSVYMITELSGKEEHGTVNGVTDNYTNLIFDDPNARIDLYFPFRSFISTGSRHWNLQFGRDSLSWGNAHSGNMMLSDYSDFYDFIGLSFYGKRIKLTNIFAVMDPISPSGDPMDGETPDTNSYAFMGRRLDIRITERVLLSLNEAVTLIDIEGELVRDLNYLMIFHNRMIPDRSNSLLSAELSVNPWKNLNFYGQFAMDEFQT
ncbi:MAG: hypothetical protein R6V67_05490, partial [Spirochaetia bacterium]